jgi:O-antigen/teichoic acid export membrane protein
MTVSTARFSGLSKAFGKTLLTTVGMTGIGFLSSIVTARILGPEGRGLMSASVMICTLAASIAQSGLANSYVYHHGAARSFPYLRFLFWSVLCVCGLACMLAYGGLFLSHEAQLRGSMGLIVLLTIFTASQTYFFSLSQLHPDLFFFNVLRFSVVSGNLLLLIPLLIWFKPVVFQQILLMQLLVLFAVTTAAMLWSRRHKVWQLTEAKGSATLSQMLRYGLSQHGTSLLSLFLLNFDKLVLLNRSSMVEYGYYALAFSTSRLIGAVQEAISVALFARFAGRDADKLSEAVNTAFRLTLLPLLVIAAFGALVAPWFLVFVYGKAFSGVTIPFGILLFECVIGGASWTLAQRFNASGKPGLVLVRQFVSVVPVFIAMPFLPRENTFVYLALLMLCGACLRLIMTLVLYAYKLKEPLPPFVPTRNDYLMVKGILLRKTA